MNAPQRQLTVIPQPSAPMVPVDDLCRMAEAMAKSGLFGMKTPEQAMALMLVAQAENKHPAIAARDYDIIQNRPAKKSEAMMRDFIAAGGQVRWSALSDQEARATFSHPQGGEVEISWDMKRAATAGLLSKDMYKKFPRQMLRARCISEGVRTVCPLATGGMYAPEEVIDITPAAESETTAASVAEERKTELIAQIRAAETHEAVLAVWQTAAAECEKAKDRDAYREIKTAAAERRKELDTPPEAE